MRPDALRHVTDNDLADVGLRFCSDPTPTPTPTPTATPTATATVEGATDTDREALVALYNATDGANWRFNGNWLSQEPLGTWYGVNTDASGRVTELRLLTNSLNGALPAALGNLDKLKVLQFSRNQLSGSIPGELGNLVELVRLDLRYNQLSGRFQARWATSPTWKNCTSGITS